MAATVTSGAHVAHERLLTHAHMQIHGDKLLDNRERGDAATNGQRREGEREAR